MKTTLQLFLEISEKIKNNHESSGSVVLVKSGRLSILKKMLEESAEIWMACKFEDDEQKALEISQFVYYVILFCIQAQMKNETIHSLLSGFETEITGSKTDRPNKELIYLTTDLTSDHLSENERIEKIQEIFSVLNNLISSNNLTKTDIYKKL